MMGYRDPNDNDEEREAERWDTVLHDFGVREYVHQRYMGTAQSKETVMDFTVSISGTASVEVDLSEIDLSRYIDQELPDGFDLTQADASDGTVEVDVDFEGSMDVELDDDDLATLVREKVEADFRNFTNIDVTVE